MKLLSFLGVLTLAAGPALSVEVSSKELKKYKKQLRLFEKKKTTLGLREFIEDRAAENDPQTVVLVPPAGIAVPKAAFHELAVERLSKLRNREAIEALVKMLSRRKEDVRHRMLILDAFGRRGDSRSLEVIIEQLRSKTSLVQIAAVRAAARRKDRDVVAPLIDLLDARWKARDRVWAEIRVALHRLTAQDFASVEDWRKFWSAHGGNFNPRKVGRNIGDDSDRTLVDLKLDDVEFFGGQINSHNLIFVIDTSSSMLQWDDADSARGSLREKERRRQRLRRAKVELARALKKLPRSARFNIIAYSDTVAPWSKRLQLATNSNVQSALRFIGLFRAEGKTHTDEALELALRDLRVDTVVLLSDGSPEKKDYVAPVSLPEKILQWVRDVYPSRKVRIDTFGFAGIGSWPEKLPLGGSPPPPQTPLQVHAFEDFLKQLAKETGGVYRPIK